MIHLNAKKKIQQTPLVVYTFISKKHSAQKPTYTVWCIYMSDGISAFCSTTLVKRKILWWLGARLRYLQCISTGDTTVLHRAINMYIEPTHSWLLHGQAQSLRILSLSMSMGCLIQSSPNITQSIFSYIFHKTWSMQDCCYSSVPTMPKASEKIVSNLTVELWSVLYQLKSLLNSLLVGLDLFNDDTRLSGYISRPDFVA